MMPLEITIKRTRRPYSARPLNGDVSVKAKTLYRILKTMFTLDELDGLCIELDIACEDLNGTTITGKSAAFIRAVVQRRRLRELEQILRRDRPEAFKAQEMQ